MMMRRWRKILGSTSVRALGAVLLATSIIGFPLASSGAWLQGTALAAPQFDYPPGQLKRRGLSGTVVGMGGSYITLETKFGDVEVQIEPGKTVIHVPPEGKFIAGERDLDDYIQHGQKVAILLDRSPVDPSEPAPDELDEDDETDEDDEADEDDETDEDDED